MDRLLVTGAAGRVASGLIPLLRQRYKLRLLDRKPPPQAAAEDEVLVADINRTGAAAEAVAGCRGVLDLMCVHGEHLGFEDTLDANYRGLLALLQASAEGGVERVVYVSSLHIVGMHHREGFDLKQALVAPDGFYGLSKAFGEAACAMYAKRFGLRTLLLRLGNVDPMVSDARRATMWISSADLAQLVTIGLEHPDIELELLSGTSRCADPVFEDPRARALGYRPKDAAEDHLAADYRGFEAMREEDGPAYVGGAYAAIARPQRGRP